MEFVEVVVCCRYDAVEGVLQVGVVGSEGELGDDVGEVEGYVS